MTENCVKSRLLGVKSSPAFEHDNPAFEIGSPVPFTGPSIDITVSEWNEKTAVNKNSPRFTDKRNSSPSRMITDDITGRRSRETTKYRKKRGSDSSHINPFEGRKGNLSSKSSPVSFLLGREDSIEQGNDERVLKVSPMKDPNLPMITVTETPDSPKVERGRSVSPYRRVKSCSVISPELSENSRGRSPELKPDSDWGRFRIRSVSPSRTDRKCDWSLGDEEKLIDQSSSENANTKDSMPWEHHDKDTDIPKSTSQPNLKGWTDGLPDKQMDNQTSVDDKSELFQTQKQRSSKWFGENLPIKWPNTKRERSSSRNSGTPEPKKNNEIEMKDVPKRYQSRPEKTYDNANSMVAVKDYAVKAEASGDPVPEVDDAVAQKIELTFKTSFEYKFGMSFAECEISGIVNFSNGMIILHNRVKNQIRVFDRDLKCLTSCEVPPARAMSAHNDHSRIALASGREIIFCKIKSYKSKQIADKQISIKSIVKACARVGNFYFVVCDSNGHGVLFILTKHKEKMKDKVKTALLNKWKVTHIIKSFQLEDMSSIVSMCGDTANDRAFICDAKYRKILAVTSTGVVSFSVNLTWLPRGIVLVQGYLIVCNDSDHSVCLLSTKGQFIKTLIQGLHFNPANLAYDPDSSRLMVSSLRGSSVRMYNLHSPMDGDSQC